MTPDPGAVASDCPHGSRLASDPETAAVPDQEVRARALLALQQGHFDLAERLLGSDDLSQAALVESLRIYQAELEIQNEELQHSYERAQYALARFMTFFDSLPMPELILDTQGIVKEANSEARHLFGLRDTGYHRHFFIRMIAEEHRGVVISALSKIRVDASIQLRELRFRTLHEEPFIGDLHLTGMKLEAEHHLSVLCAIVDRTAAVQQRKALQESRERYRIVAEFSADWEYWMGPDGHYRFISPACERLSGYPPAAFIADPDLFERLIHPDDRPLWTSHLAAHVSWIPGQSLEPEHIEFRVHHQDGQEFWIEHTCSAVFSDTGDYLGRRGVNRDITELRRSREQLHFLAQHDTLTGLPNRNLFQERLQLAILRAARHLSQVALLFLDLDRFKLVNDTLGHLIGDQILKQVAERLAEAVRATDTLARLGGDEFVIVFEDVDGARHVTKLAQRLLDLFRPAFVIEGRELFLNLSIGISLYPSDGIDAETLLRHADIAMYRAKENGRNGFSFFERAMSERAIERLRLEHELRKALTNHELLLVYQPQVNLHTGQLCGVEVLCRWQHPRLGRLAPAQFLPIAEEIGLIDQLDCWVLEHASRQLLDWDRLGLRLPRLAVNLSLRQLKDQDAFEQITRILAQTGLASNRLEFELSETSIMKHAPTTLANLQQLCDLGIGLAVDDFGTGCSSLICIKRLPIRRLKIDQSFVERSTHSGDDAAVVRAIIGLAHSLGLAVMAEGVETLEQAKLLIDEGCEEAQGYLYERAIGAEAFAARFLPVDSSGHSTPGERHACLPISTPQPMK
ncbi:GGDEF domain-containing protein [Thiocapsa imhoffii]|uniref:GGDEF domain-containing protein n=1 Tax=Thiocapsa imhoffii TaxID=382777 RepID=A0A9X0WKC1_9GAMM|nr:GGDEF and EAL domain-containing protein [Thiocapsa imhoffii]MBK1646321.1 GGDEF domain-containing protein [Thiocapsa imhoffii]